MHELAALPVCITQWALTAEAAEAEGERIARDLAQQEADLRNDDEG